MTEAQLKDDAGIKILRPDKCKATVVLSEADRKAKATALFNDRDSYRVL